MQTPEAKVKTKLKRYFAEERKNGHELYFYWPVPTGFGETTLDCLCCYDGKFIGIECKREGIRKPTPRQAAVMARIRAAGGVTYLVTMKDGELEWIEIK